MFPSTNLVHTSPPFRHEHEFALCPDSSYHIKYPPSMPLSVYEVIVHSWPQMRFVRANLQCRHSTKVGTEAWQPQAIYEQVYKGLADTLKPVWHHSHPFPSAALSLFSLLSTRRHIPDSATRHTGVRTSRDITTLAIGNWTHRSHGFHAMPAANLSIRRNMISDARRL